MAKNFYIGIPNDHIKYCLANFVINKQVPIWDKNNFYKYRKMSPTLKIWLFLESDFFVFQIYRMSKYKINQLVVTTINISIFSMDQLFNKKCPSKIYFLQTNKEYFKYVYVVKITQIPIE